MSETPKTENETKPGFQQGSATSDDEAHPANKQENLSERLDDALEETFPSSDPISVKITK